MTGEPRTTGERSHISLKVSKLNYAKKGTVLGKGSHISLKVSKSSKASAPRAAPEFPYILEGI